jgi:hypothetical protein
LNPGSRITTRLIVGFLTFIAMGSVDGQAKCAGFPSGSHVHADVQVWSCIGATFGAVGRRFYDFGPLYESGATFSGTLLDVEVKSSRLVWDDPKARKAKDGSRPWKPGELLTLFVSASADEVCPNSMQSDLTVVTREQCCDLLPLKGQCLVPRYLNIVTVVPK